MAKKGTTKYKSNLQEKSVAKQFGGKQVIASGALWFAHSDVRSDKFLIECKTTKKSFYTLTAKTWEKIEREAIRDHLRIPLMVIDLEDKDRVVVFRPQDFNVLITSVIANTPKSVRIYYEEFMFRICGEKYNVLKCMPYKDFKDKYKEELDWD